MDHLFASPTRSLVIALSAALLLPAFPTHGALQDVPEGAIVVIPMRQEINDGLFFFMRRALKAAERAKAQGVILDMNTPGGSLTTTKKMVEALLKTTSPVVTYVNTEAFSAGALISLATHSIYVAPTSAIGAAAIVMGGGQDLPETIQDKATSGYSAFFRSVAEQRGHNPDIATAFMDKKKGLTVGGTVISATGSLLSFSAREATQVINGKPVLAKAIVNSVEEVATKEGWTGPLHTFEPTGFETVAFWLGSIAPLLLTVGLVAAYIEFQSPGFGVAGIIAAICFLLFFSANYLAGLAGLELVALFFLGFTLVLIELIFFPGILIIGLPGAALMIGCLLFAMVDAYPNQGLSIPLESFVGPLTTLAATVIASAIFLALFARFLPHAPGLKRLVLASTIGDVKEAMEREASLGVSVGAVGTAISPLRPSGKGFFDGRVLDVKSPGDFIPRDTAIRVVRLEGNVVIVEAAAPSQAS